MMQHMCNGDVRTVLDCADTYVPRGLRTLRAGLLRTSLLRALCVPEGGAGQLAPGPQYCARTTASGVPTMYHVPHVPCTAAPQVLDLISRSGARFVLYR